MSNRPRKPWPLKWIAAAIVVYIAGYTVVNLRYRKPGPEFQPYEQFQERAGLAKAGYRHIPARVSWPADPRFARTDAAFSDAPGGLPRDLGAALAVGTPLPAAIGRVSAESEATHDRPYGVQFGCSLADNRTELGGAEIYLKEGDITIVADIERLPGGLLTRTRENVVLLEVPPGAIPAGRYRVTLVGEHASKAWPLLVR
jgi:hypothetical protein